MALDSSEAPKLYGALGGAAQLLEGGQSLDVIAVAWKVGKETKSQSSVLWFLIRKITPRVTSWLACTIFPMRVLYTNFVFCDGVLSGPSLNSSRPGPPTWGVLGVAQSTRGGGESPGVRPSDLVRRSGIVVKSAGGLTPMLSPLVAESSVEWKVKGLSLSSCQSFWERLHQLYAADWRVVI